MSRIRVALVLALLPMAVATVHAQSTTTNGPQARRDPAERVASADELTARGQRLVRSGDPGSAVWYLREALRFHPAHAPAAIALADIYLARNEPASARDVLVDAVSRTPSHATLWLRLAGAFRVLRLGDSEAEALREGLRHSPRDPDLLAAAANIAMQRGEWVRALSLLRALTAAGVQGNSGASDDSNEAALGLMAGTSDRARGLRCDPNLTAIRRALSHCPAPPSPSSVSSPTINTRR